jgi:hypothetical protein
MADKKDEEVPDLETPAELPSPRFDIVSKMFDEVDEMIAKYDASDNLTIFEMEILLMMLRKKIDHIGIVAALSQGEQSKPSDPNMYN